MFVLYIRIIYSISCYISDTVCNTFQITYTFVCEKRAISHSCIFIIYKKKKVKVTEIAKRREFLDEISFHIFKHTFQTFHLTVCI